jgi:phosphorylcholine phosphatase
VVRMVVSDPRYGLNIPPERVIGVNLMLSKPDGTVTVGAFERLDGRTGLDYYFSTQRMQWTLGTYPFAPMTWYGGKVAAISEWIDPAQRPILVGGDSPNDFYMQFYSAVDDAGLRLRIHRTEEHKNKLEENKLLRQNGNVNQDPQKGWIEVSAKDLGLS